MDKCCLQPDQNIAYQTKQSGTWRKKLRNSVTVQDFSFAPFEFFPSRKLEVSVYSSFFHWGWEIFLSSCKFIDKETPQNERRKCQQAIVPQRQVQSIKLIKILYFQMLRVIQCANNDLTAIKSYWQLTLFGILPSFYYFGPI